MPAIAKGQVWMSDRNLYEVVVLDIVPYEWTTNAVLLYNLESNKKFCVDLLLFTASYHYTRNINSVEKILYFLEEL